VPDLAPDVVARVNDRTIRQDELRRMQAADRAMAELLGQSPTGDDVLERLVNGELVWQAAEAAGFALEEGQVTQSLQGFLAARGKPMTALEQALAANGLSLGDFKAYFGRLLLVDQFSRAQAQAQGVTVAEYLGRLQRAARISFGPAAEMAVTQPGNLQPTATVLPAQSEVAATGVVSEAPMATVTAATPRGTAEGQYAPLFELPAINNPAADFLSLNDLAGKPALLSFWTTWCPYCQRQTPVLVDAYNRYAERGVQFVGINVRENQEQVQEYIRANGIPYPIVLDAGGEVAGRYAVTGFPTTYFLDVEGRIVARHLGQLSSEQVDSYLQQLLALQNP